MTKIKDKHNIDSTQLSTQSPLDKWFLEMIDKSEDDLSIKDLSHMLRQGVFLEVAVQKSWIELKNDPLAGEMYDGELLKLLIRVLKENKQYQRIEDYNEFMDNIKNSSHVWENSYEKEEYEKLLEQLVIIF